MQIILHSFYCAVRVSNVVVWQFGVRDRERTHTPMSTIQRVGAILDKGNLDECVKEISMDQMHKYMAHVGRTVTWGGRPRTLNNMCSSEINRRKRLAAHTMPNNSSSPNSSSSSHHHSNDDEDDYESSDDDDTSTPRSATAETETETLEFPVRDEGGIAVWLPLGARMAHGKRFRVRRGTTAKAFWTAVRRFYAQPLVIQSDGGKTADIGMRLSDTLPNRHLNPNVMWNAGRNMWQVEPAVRG